MLWLMKVACEMRTYNKQSKRLFSYLSLLFPGSVSVTGDGLPCMG